ncbi:MAG: Transcriptional regulator, RpiR family [Clostridiaceae bacterium]|nr:Transcriptional regulator, RpiR family [Clostridiaceae bacterium]
MELGSEVKMPESLNRIKEIIEHLNLSEKKVADYILNNPKRVSDLSIKELAEESGSSQSAVVRLCKRLHYKGYKDFRIMIAKDSVDLKEEEDMYSDIKPGDSISTIIRNISFNNKKSIDNTMEFLSVESVNKAINAIVKTERIDFYGVGASYVVCLDAFEKFTRINKNIRVSQDTHLQTQFASSLKEGDVAIAISYSGETRDTYDSIKTAKDMGATTISITKFGHNTISDLCDIKLFVSSPEINCRSCATSSRIALLNVIDILFTSTSSCMFDDIKVYLENTRKAISKKRFK